MPVNYMILVVTLFLSALPQKNSTLFQTTTKPKAIVITESLTEVSSHGTDQSDCALVFPDGRVHIERYKQQLPDQSSTVVYRSKFAKSQLHKLEEILSDPDMQSLPEFTSPSTPLSVKSLQYVTLEMVYQEKRSRRVGYFKWAGGADKGWPNITPEKIKAEWQHSEPVLQPLLKWFHDIEGISLDRSDAKPTQCKVY
jgi:hypothetical protein